MTVSRGPRLSAVEGSWQLPWVGAAVRGSSAGAMLQQLDGIAEWVMDQAATIAVLIEARLIFARHVPLAQLGARLRQIVWHHGEVVIRAAEALVRCQQVHLLAVAQIEPHARLVGQRRRPRQLAKAQDLAIEVTRHRLLIGRIRDLDVVHILNLHGMLLLPGAKRRGGAAGERRPADSPPSGSPQE